MVRGPFCHRQSENRKGADPGREPTWTPETAVSGKGNRAARGLREGQSTAQEWPVP